jgi:thiamine-monophosphate kinase
VARPEMPTGEFELIARYFAPLSAGFPGAVNLQDDVATFAPSAGCELAMTVDTMVSGVHFFPSDPADLIGRKLLRVNLSDLAASGATPLCYLLAISLNKAIDEDWIQAFAGGLALDQAQFDVALAGGDTTATPGPLTLSLTAIGEVPTGQAVRRAGAAASEDVWVTGTIGDAALALMQIENIGVLSLEADQPELLNRFRLPQPRTGLGPALVGLVSAMADVSDGLLADLGHICTASRIGAEIVFGDIPLSDAANDLFAKAQEGRDDCVARVLTGGDDYELLFTAAPGTAAEIERRAAQCGIPVTRIGRTVDRLGVRAVSADGTEIDVPNRGWQHF